VILTSNDERDLPQAFLRRCVVLVLEDPGRDRLQRIAERHFPALAETEVLTAALAEYARANETAPGPSVAELLDLLAALTELDAQPGSPQWADTVALVLEKATGPLP
jgi:MoxR-like ATPase